MKRSHRIIAFTLVELLIVIAIISLLMAILMPGALWALEMAHRVVCANRLRQIGVAAHSYARSRDGRWPDLYRGAEGETWHAVGEGREAGAGGAMPIPVESNTANLWLLARVGITEDTRIFVCPSSDHTPDRSVSDPASVWDFAGPEHVSYSYQNVLGRYAIGDSAPATLAVAADANPQRADFAEAVERHLAGEPRFEVPEWGAIDPDAPWELNSPNHQFRGQNVVYAGGHVEWKDHPYAGRHHDNIWVRRTADGPESSPADMESLRAWDDGGSYGRTDRGLTPGDTVDTMLAP
jgi:prepilin-type N-terminal cleavage/methylation domain-containing protein